MNGSDDMRNENQRQNAGKIGAVDGGRCLYREAGYDFAGALSRVVAEE